MDDEHRIRQRAYEIWEREGRPEGRRHEHWAEARRELESAGTPGQPDDSPTVTAPDHGGATPGQAAAAAKAVGAPRNAEPPPGTAGSSSPPMGRR